MVQRLWVGRLLRHRKAQLLLVNLLTFGLEVCLAAGITYVPPLLLEVGVEEKFMTMVLGESPHPPALVLRDMPPRKQGGGVSAQRAAWKGGCCLLPLSQWVSVAGERGDPGLRGTQEEEKSAGAFPAHLPVSPHTMPGPKEALEKLFLTFVQLLTIDTCYLILSLQQASEVVHFTEEITEAYKRLGDLARLYS